MCVHGHMCTPQAEAGRGDGLSPASWLPRREEVGFPAARGDNMEVSPREQCIRTTVGSIEDPFRGL